MKTVLPDRQKNIVQWVSQATGINTLGVKVRLQGNDLHILCESVECPQRWHTLTDLLKALQQTDLDALKNNEHNEQPSIYQVFVYGRKKSSPKPEWCHRVYLNQLDRHLEQVNQALIRDSERSNPAGALIISNESLARQGDPDALARYLSETLSMLGVSVQVKVKKQKPLDTANDKSNSRLWILCRAIYSPDPSLIAEPIAQKLRHLKLSGYQDAVIATQVQGETKPDWLLRIDLTPPEVMVKEWARWGDIQAIALYLNEKLNELSDTKIQVTTSLKESTLHVFCTASAVPDRKLCMEIGTILEAIAPQAITAATIYGQPKEEAQPAWIDWLSLPAGQHPPLAISPLELASSADEPAIIFLLERLLNPDLNWRLKTGGIRVLLLRKGDLMHVMCDAPVCPTRKQVASKVTQLLRQLQIPGITGVRVYGRRAGNKEPFWHHGADFQVRQRFVPEPAPEFAVTDAFVRELLPSDSNESALRPDLTVEEVQTFFTLIARHWGATAKKFLLGTQLFMDGQPSEHTSETRGRLVALIWGTLGLLLALQTDWILNRFVSRPNAPTIVGSPTNTNASDSTAIATNNSERANSSFNASAFTQINGNNSTESKATATAILLAARAQTATFNARQLDEQLALYKQRLQKIGKPPDVLIIGSSRALRGVDPVALSKALATQGYRNIDVFNFGINGATVQVVDFILRKVLQPSELPKLVIWADGARAFNSGREDMTYSAIAASPGYKQANERYIARGNAPDADKNAKSKPGEENNKNSNQQETSYEAVNKWLNQNLASLSGTYQHRDQLKSLINQQFKTLPIVKADAQASNTKTNSTDLEEEAAAQSVDFDGFLPLSIRFDPVTYYQKHPKVAGNYDNDYKSFQLAGDQDAALQNILKFAQLQKISLVFVNMPLTSEYLDPIRAKHEQEFQQYMLQIAAERPNFIFRDLSLLYPQQNDFFSDPSHLNRYGAYEVSNKLAKDLMIPWSNKKVLNSNS